MHRHDVQVSDTVKLLPVTILFFSLSSIFYTVTFLLYFSHCSPTTDMFSSSNTIVPIYWSLARSSSPFLSFYRPEHAALAQLPVVTSNVHSTTHWDNREIQRTRHALQFSCIYCIIIFIYCHLHKKNSFVWFDINQQSRIDINPRKPCRLSRTPTTISLPNSHADVRRNEREWKRPRIEKEDEYYREALIEKLYFQLRS